MILPRSIPIMAEKKTRQRTEVVERGNIWFIYRPKVRAEDEPEQDVGASGMSSASTWSSGRMGLPASA